MNKGKLSLIICSCVCAILAVVVTAIGLTYSGPLHKHSLREGKTYHIYQDHVYYTQQCKNGCKVEFETNASLKDIFVTANSGDKIVLEEDMVLTEEMSFNAFTSSETGTVPLKLNIDLDLNGFTLSTDIDNLEHDSMFRFNVNRGELDLKVSNGKLSSQDALYIFRFKNNSESGENIKLTLNNVDCEVSGIKATPLFMAECQKVKVSATNSKFVSNCTGTQKGDYGVGAFINSNSEFNFNNCYFEGGDALYVKAGTVRLTGCKLVNEGLADRAYQGVDTFSATGACLTADSHTTGEGRTIFNITIVDCEMVANNCAKMIYVIETTDGSGSASIGIDNNSRIRVESCSFSHNPLTASIPRYENVEYPNGTPKNNGTETWVCG